MPQWQLIVFVALVTIATPLAAANIVQNPSFNGNLAGWLASGTTFDTADATGVPGSGSARSTVSVVGGTIALTQCIPAVPGIYTLSGKVLIPSGQTTTGWGTIAVAWFSGGDCSSGGAIGVDSVTVGTIGSFLIASTPTGAPPGTTFARIICQHVSFSSAPHIVNFDDIVLDGPTNVPALGPLSLAVMMFTLAVLGAWILRR